jgi:uncharacterized caspase-like protein
MILLSACFSESTAKTYLVSVGIGDYSLFEGAGDLTLPPADAKTMADLYAKNTSVSYALLLDTKATKRNILAAIDKVFKEAEANDIVIFYFSGHGYQGGFCAADGKLSYKEVRKAMASSKSKNKMMLVDACYAGCVRVDAQNAESAESSAQKANVMMFLASRNTESAQELRNMTNGLFTNYLNEGLRGRADANKDRTITAKELFDYVSVRVAKASRGEQHPVMWGKFSDSMPVMIW